MRRVGLALDIDGVFLRGSTVLPFATKTIRSIVDNKFPFIFITNGGGVTEREKAADLSNKLECAIDSSQILLAHTPMRDLAKKYANENVLVLGSENCIRIAREYGFNKPFTAAQIHQRIPEIYPLKRGKRGCSSDETEAELSNLLVGRNSGVRAAFVFHDPTDWALEMQVLADSLLGDLNNTSELDICKDAESENKVVRQEIPMYVSNADLIYMASFHRPRFTQGAFIEAFRSIFTQYAGFDPAIQYYGKPFQVQYRQAELMIKQQAVKLGVSPPRVFIGIGDNTKADIRGANQAGEHWRSCLVRTGVYRGNTNDETDAADFFFENVGDAIDAFVEDSRAWDEIISSRQE